MKPYRYITLCESDLLSLELGHQRGSKHHFRERCHAVLLSHRNYTIPQIAVLLGKRRETIHQWFNRWSVFGLEGLRIKAGRGLKANLSHDNAELVAEIKKK
jgi:transposase